ncbi:MAG: fibrobacter succinogenes major paralogous domain-containing protein [Bacteroidales bacterium]|nr:fibrobacter succinogenes major paralogous domain-containing protein [Bacteroidales bacterium]
MSRSVKISVILLIVFSIFSDSCIKEDINIKEDIYLPEVSTNYVEYVRRTSATLDGSYIFNEYDSLINYGFCWNTTNFPTMEDSIAKTRGSSPHFRSYLHGLIPNTTYYARAYATNQDGTGYGEEKKFTTKTTESSITYNADLEYGTISDIDGNVYKTIDIGTQTWMAENLRTTRYSDNSEIPLITDYDAWEHVNTPGYCWYENNEEIYKNIYGAYYNWYAVDTDKLCPSGWHVPSDEEWKILEMFLGMSQEQVDSWGNRGTSEGIKIKETGTSNWDPEGHIDGTNESGFTALPGGLRWGYDQSVFDGEGIVAFWWTSGRISDNQWATSRFLFNLNSMILRDSRDLTSGFNVRCIAD